MMGFFKRLGLILYALAALFCLASLFLYEFDVPYHGLMVGFFAYEWYRMAVVATMGVTALGALICLLRALFTPRRRKEVMVSKDGQDSVTVAASAISSVASHIVERSGDLAADRVRVLVKGRDKVQVKVRVRPHNLVNIVQEGNRLRTELSEGLAAVCGDHVGAIQLEFVQADSDEFVEQHEHVEAADVHVEVPEGDEFAPVPTDTPSQDFFGVEHDESALDDAYAARLSSEQGEE